MISPRKGSDVLLYGGGGFVALILALAMVSLNENEKESDLLVKTFKQLRQDEFLWSGLLQNCDTVHAYFHLGNTSVLGKLVTEWNTFSNALNDVSYENRPRLKILVKRHLQQTAQLMQDKSPGPSQQTAAAAWEGKEAPWMGSMQAITEEIVRLHQQERQQLLQVIEAMRRRRATVMLLMVTAGIGLVGLAVITTIHNRRQRRRQEQWDKVLELCPDLICLAGFDGRLVWVNHAFTRTLGWSAAELTSQPFIEWVHPEDRPRTEAATRSLAEGRAVMDFENRYRCRNGDYHWLEWRSIALTSARLIVAVARDITERKTTGEIIQQLHADLLRRTQQLETANQELESFSYSVSHDLRAPLRSLDGFSKILQEDYGDRLDNTARDYLRRIRDASQRMGELIEDLLRLSRLTRQELQWERVDLGKLAREVAEELQRRQPERTVHWEIAGDVMVEGDARLLRIAMENLLSNAWKYTLRCASAHIEFGVQKGEGPAVYYVRDNGVGFDMAYAGRLFGAFQRLHRAADYPGTGIGLATVQRIIQRHGGRIWAEAAVDKGATFYFTLSAAPPSGPPAKTTHPPSAS